MTGAFRGQKVCFPDGKERIAERCAEKRGAQCDGISCAETKKVLRSRAEMRASEDFFCLDETLSRSGGRRRFVGRIPFSVTLVPVLCAGPFRPSGKMSRSAREACHFVCRAPLEYGRIPQLPSRRAGICDSRALPVDRLTFCFFSGAVGRRVRGRSPVRAGR